MTSLLAVLEQTRVPDKNHRLTLSHGQLFHMLQPGFESGSGERQRAVSDSALDHLVISAAALYLLIHNLDLLIHATQNWTID